MKDFSRRSTETELIDRDDIPAAAWNRCLDELNRINTYLGGHAVTIRGLRTLVQHASRPFTVAEIGCGGGDNLKAIHEWNKSKDIPIRYIGIDLNQACIAFARSNCTRLPATFIHADYRDVDFDGSPPDIIFSSLFCHHFSNHELVGMFRWCRSNSRIGFFVNDLQRHPVAYHSISGLTRLFSSSYLVKNDAPVSVLRGFRRPELEDLLVMAGVKHYFISWHWAFRYLVLVKNE
jgi:ubiquinone/menaquinone biosynthesis C-methylase UbiE